MDFVFGGGVIVQGPSSTGGAETGTNAASTIGLSHENGPILYSEPNRTSAIDDIRSIVIYIFIITVFLSFFLILPGIRSEKFPTFLCITTSLIVTSIILISLFGTTWHVAESPISAAYKAFSRDRIQGELNVKIGLQSVNITLKAYKYYILHSTDGPVIMDNSPPIVGSSPASSMLMSMMSSSSASASSPSAISSSTSGQSVASLGTSESQDSVMKKLPTPTAADQTNQAAASLFIDDDTNPNGQATIRKDSSLAEELLGGRTSDGLLVDTELEVDEVFATRAASARWVRSSAAVLQAQATNKQERKQVNQRVRRRSAANQQQPEVINVVSGGANVANESQKVIQNATRPKRQDEPQQDEPKEQERLIKQEQQQNGSRPGTSPATPKFTIKRVNVDINYNERFYWIEPNQMQQEYHNALERGLPYPILTVVEYLSQDEAGFNWSRQYRAAGYYSSILLWLSVCACILMFCLHCAAPKYGIYTMQAIGCLLLFTNLTYFILVPRGEQKLVIPFEGQSLAFKFGWNFWLVLIGGCLSLVVGTIIVIIDNLFPNYIFTTILDVDYDSQHKYYKTRKSLKRGPRREMITDGHSKIQFRQPSLPPFYGDSAISSKASLSSNQSVASSFTSSPRSTRNNPAGKWQDEEMENFRQNQLNENSDRQITYFNGKQNVENRVMQWKTTMETTTVASLETISHDATDTKLANTNDTKGAHFNDDVGEISTANDGTNDIMIRKFRTSGSVFSQSNESESRLASEYSGGSSSVVQIPEIRDVDAEIDILNQIKRRQQNGLKLTLDMSQSRGSGAHETRIGKPINDVDYHNARL